MSDRWWVYILLVLVAWGPLSCGKKSSDAPVSISQQIVGSIEPIQISGVAFKGPVVETGICLHNLETEKTYPTGVISDHEGKFSFNLPAELQTQLTKPMPFYIFGGCNSQYGWFIDEATGQKMNIVGPTGLVSMNVDGALILYPGETKVKNIAITPLSKMVFFLAQRLKTKAGPYP